MLRFSGTKRPFHSLGRARITAGCMHGEAAWFAMQALVVEQRATAAFRAGSLKAEILLVIAKDMQIAD
ncbi:hypothetical protein [Bradyrhizobium glycinis]|uniref:hypothetical protein n=1 Tax=Bradyrhizobium glycinis TaxID=2751812 RepID=UPI0018D935B3|nr:hypothetical protein [Bradyrhizobium glycinis]MBH5370505.1 hypothetical protein [Bradyrhizobium glycinis]